MCNLSTNPLDPSFHPLFAHAPLPPRDAFSDAAPLAPTDEGATDTVLAISAVPTAPDPTAPLGDPLAALADTVEAVEGVIANAINDAVEEFAEMEEDLEAHLSRLSRFERFTASMGAWTCGIFERMQPPAGPFFVSDGRLIAFDEDNPPVKDGMTPTGAHH